MNQADSRSHLRNSSQESLENSSVESGPGGLGWRSIPMQPISVSTYQQHPQTHHSPRTSISSLPPPPVAGSTNNKLRRIPNAPYSFDCPVSAEALKLVDTCYRSIDEFKNVTYTPILCHPEDFQMENKYSLRQNRNGRSTELLIAVSMYNENDEFLSRTLASIFKNIKYFCQLNQIDRSVVVGNARRGSAQSEVSVAVGTDKNTFVKNSQSFSNPHLEAAFRGDQIWTEDGWQKIVLVIISDGRQKIHHRAKKMLQAMGVYQDELIMPQVVDPLDSQCSDPKDVTAHLFEYTCQAVIDKDFELRSGSRQGIVPVQVLFCLKEKNAKKLNSHKWLFRAFAPLLNPNVIVLVDVGTRPKTNDSIYHLWKAFDRNMNIAGTAGEICVMMGRNCETVKNVFHPMVASQNFEYKMSNILDKSLESCFGYISVLPGAFSAYRWEALQDTDHEKGPLISYFKGEKPNPKGNVFTSNMYLAEDRILCFELVAKSHSKWLLHYVKDARAETDVPTDVAEFVSQRRRWLNGTFFSQVYAVWHMSRFWKTNHSFLRKCALSLQFFYFILNLLFSWFGIANFYLAFYLLTTQTFGSPTVASLITQELSFYILRVIYLSIMIAQFICALGNRPQGAKAIFIGSMVLFAIIMMFMVAVTIILVSQSFYNLTPNQNWFVHGGTSRDMVISIASTYGVYAFSSIIYGESAHIITCLVQYLLLLPSYVNTLTIYAFCNSHDVSWGTKGDNKANVGHGMKKQSKLLSDETSMLLSVNEPPLLTDAALSASYRQATSEVTTPPQDEIETIDPGTKREDYYKNFRTWFVLFWALSNGLLVAIVSSPTVSTLLTGNGDANFSNPYMQFIMYSVAFFSVIRLCGCIYYLVKRAIRKY